MRSAHLALVTLLLCPTLTAYASRQIVPAGSLINCTVSETKISSKTAGIGDPVLCQAGITTRNGGARLPFNTYLEGRFEDYKDPGHFVGKGWMELRFDRMVIEPRTVIPVSARVVDVPGYAVDQQGRILGKGHRTRDIVEWCIPILWPIDLLNLPRRGPRPILKTETRLTVKVMDDMEVPITEDPDRDPSGLYRREPSAYNDAPQYEPQQQMAQQPAYQQPPPTVSATAAVSAAVPTAAVSTTAVSAAATELCSACTGSSVYAGNASLCGSAADGVCVYRSASAADGLYVCTTCSRNVVAAENDVLSERVRVSDWVWVSVRLLRHGKRKMFHEVATAVTSQPSDAAGCGTRR